MPRIKYCNGGHSSQSKWKTLISVTEYRKQEKKIIFEYVIILINRNHKTALNIFDYGIIMALGFCAVDATKSLTC